MLPVAAAELDSSARWRESRADGRDDGRTPWQKCGRFGLD